MIEYAAFGFAVLVWWTWPALWAVVVTAVYASHRVSAWRDRQLEAKQERGPEPCLIHMGTDPDGFEHWCWLKDGHAGPHTNQWGVPQGDFDDELEDKEQAEEDGGGDSGDGGTRGGRGGCVSGHRGCAPGCAMGRNATAPGPPRSARAV